MKSLQKSTLSQLCEQLAAYPWDDAELEELVDSKLGIITGFRVLLEELEKLGRIDLGSLPPAQCIRSMDDDH